MNMSFSDKYRIFKRKHRTLHNVINLSYFLIPVFINIAVLFIIPEERSVLAVYSFVGGFIFSLGLLIWAVADYDKNSFLKIFIYPVVVGTVMMAFNITYACNNNYPFNENLFEFQLISYLLDFGIGGTYFLLRKAINDYISFKTKLSINKIDDEKEGFLGNLWFQKLHDKYNLGWIYHFNAAITVLIFLSFFTTFFITFFKRSAAIALLVLIITSIFTLVLHVFSIILGRKTKKRYFLGYSKRLLGKIPYFYDIFLIYLALMFLYRLYQDYLLI